MEDTLKNAYAEVAYILEILGNEYKQKLPPKVLNIFEEKTSSDYQLKINKGTKIEDIKISRNALIIISILNFKYWEENTEKKEELKKQYDHNEMIYQEKINVYKQNDWLKNRRTDKITTETKTETSLIEQKEISIIARIIRFFKNLIHSRK